MILETVAVMMLACPGVHSAEYAEPVAEALQNIPWDAPEQRKAALVMTVGCFESRWLERIQAGQCHKDECDRGRARSFFQLQHTWATRDNWSDLLGLEHANIYSATDSAIRVLRSGLSTCHSVRGALSYYAVGRCAWGGVNSRVSFERRLERGSYR